MSDLDTEFNNAKDNMAKLKTRPDDRELLNAYGLFKQATIGDCTEPQPGMFSLKERAKHDAWTKRKGLSKEEAKKEYVAQYNKLVEKYGLQ